jgi:hypothetical protein
MQWEYTRNQGNPLILDVRTNVPDALLTTFWGSVRTSEALPLFLHPGADLGGWAIVTSDKNKKRAANPRFFHRPEKDRPSEEETCLFVFCLPYCAEPRQTVSGPEAGADF